MALVNCFECQREVSDQARTCPHCGAPVHLPPTKNQRWSKLQLILAGLLFIALFAANRIDHNSVIRPGEWDRITIYGMLGCGIWWTVVRIKMWFDRD